MRHCNAKSIARLDDRHTLTTMCNSSEFTLNMDATAKSNQPIECEPLCEA